VRQNQKVNWLDVSVRLKRIDLFASQLLHIMYKELSSLVAFSKASVCNVFFSVFRLSATIAGGRDEKRRVKVVSRVKVISIAT